MWDALTSDRAYRPGWDPAHALAHIEAGRGTHFDPAVVDALVRVIAERGFATTATPATPKKRGRRRRPATRSTSEVS